MTPLPLGPTGVPMEETERTLDQEMGGMHLTGPGAASCVFGPLRRDRLPFPESRGSFLEKALPRGARDATTCMMVSKVVV